MKCLIFALTSIFAVSSSYAQTFKDVFSPKSEITWLGLDFTGAKFFGKRESFGTEREIRKLVLALNDLMIDEADKYDIGKAIERRALKNEIQIAIDHNEKLDVNSLFEGSMELRHMNRDEISKIVASYDFKSLKGIGVMFFVESFSKTEIKGLVWVAFINLESKEVLFADRLSGAPEGFGLRNYWAKVIYKALGELELKYKNWKKSYTK